MKNGDTVYTVNAKTNKVDTWTYNGVMRTPTEILCHLSRDKKYCFIPARCVFKTEAEALAVAEKK